MKPVQIRLLIVHQEAAASAAQEALCSLLEHLTYKSHRTKLRAVLAQVRSRAMHQRTQMIR